MISHKPDHPSSIWPTLPSIMLMVIAASPAHAQLTLPAVQVPQLPAVGGIPVNPAVGAAMDAVNPEQLRDLKRVRIRDLLRTQRATLEAGPRGAPIVRTEVIAFSPTEAALDAARAAGFTVVRERALDALDARVVILRGPAGLSTRNTLRRLRTLDPAGVYDFNHLYFESGAAPSTPVDTPVDKPSANNAALLPAGTHIGLIDSGIATDHPVFSQVLIHRHGCNESAYPSEHGTAVASLLVGHDSHFQGAAPGAELYAADVYCGAPIGGAVDAVADAFAWLSREQVPVINVSLVGPANAVLENVIRLVIARGHMIIAAVGNDGPSAAALYPASYPGVVGVTGVDGHQRVLLEAARGKQVDFAAPGSDMAAAAVGNSYIAVRGTSFAAPIVAGLLARSLQTTDRTACDEAFKKLAAEAQDLGKRGLDTTYGNGLVGQTVRIEPRTASTD